MYSKENLSTKSLSELEEIARVLGSELTAADGEQALIEFITNGAGSEEETPTKRKRTRISSKKDDHVYTVSGSEGENLDTAKKRRGRKPKAAVSEETEESLAEPVIAQTEETAAPSEDMTPQTKNTDTNAEPVEEQPVKKRRGRRSKAEIEAAAAAAAEELMRRQKAAQETMQTELFEEEVQNEETAPAEETNMDDVPESQQPESSESLEPELIAQLQAKVTSHNESAAETPEGVWEGDPGDGTDFIIVKDLPISNYSDDESYDNDYYNEAEEEPYNKVVTHDSSVDKKEKPARPKEYSFDDIIKMNGVLEVMPDGFGFLRSSDYNYLSSPDDVFLTVQQVKRNSLKTGDVVECTVRPPHEGEKFFTLTNIIKVNGCDPAKVRDRVAFENLTPLFPEEKFTLCNDPATTNLSVRIVDLFSPIGKGQRALIVAQPKTGKTILMKDIANAISANHPEAYLMMLLIDERPEEVTDMARTVNAEVIASTFDEPADHHVKIAGLVLEKAKRLVECGHDVVIFLDSITRLARAYNTVAPASGKILTGGVDANALQKPKRFFGAARNIEGGGSLTIIATALIDTGSKMDEVIFEEFKGTGNMELQLDRQLSNKRIFPAVNLVQSSTRRDDLLHDKTTLDRMWILRKHIADMNALEAMNEIHGRIQRTKSNEEFLISMNG